MNHAPAPCAQARNCSMSGKSMKKMTTRIAIVPATTAIRRAQLHWLMDATASLQRPMRNSAKLLSQEAREDTSSDSTRAHCGNSSRHSSQDGLCNAEENPRARGLRLSE